MHLSDFTLFFVRAIGVCISALAGIAALLTDGAFTKRDPAPTGKWRDFPFVRYKISPWGMTLLAIIIMAPLIQFVGDRMKDQSDERLQEQTAGNIKTDIGKSIQSTTTQIKNSVQGATVESQKAILQTFNTENQLQLQASQKLIDQQQKIGASTSSILRQTERTLEPLRDLEFDAELVLPSDDPDVAKYLSELDSVIQRLKPKVEPGSAAALEGITFFFKDARNLNAVVIEDGSMHVPGQLGLTGLSDAISYGFGVRFVAPGHTKRDEDSLGVEVMGAQGRRLYYDIVEHKLIVEYSMSRADQKYWRNSGDFVSVADLRTSTVEIDANRNIDTTSERNKRSRTILSNSWFASFGFSPSGGVRYWSNRIPILQVHPNDISTFGAPFHKLFEFSPMVSFAARFQIDGDFAMSLDTTVTQFKRRMSGYGFRVPEAPISVRFGNDNSISAGQAVDSGQGELVIPFDRSQLRSTLLFGFCTEYLLHPMDTDIGDVVGVYLIADFMDSSQVSVAGRTIELGGPAREGEVADLSLARTLWELRKTIGAAKTGRIVASAVGRLSTDTDGSNSLQMFVEHLTESADSQARSAVLKALQEQRPVQ